MNDIPGYVRPGGRAYVSPEGIVYGTDGKLRWAYEFDQRKKPTVLVSLLWKYMWIFAAVGVLAALVQVGADGMQALTGALLVLLGAIVAGAAVAAVLFGVHLLQNGPVVCLLFTLDEQAISCRQVKGKTDKEKVTRAFAEWVGGQSQPSLRVCGMRTAQLAGVKELAVCPDRSCIRLRGTKSPAVFAEPQQLETVLEYLRRHCPNAK